MPAASKQPIRFGPFAADPASGELLRSGRTVGLQQQPFRILKMLLERRGEIVTREELRREIWGDAVHVDFERSVNTAMARLREALGDSPHRPIYIETVPRKGYRFIGSIEPPTASFEGWEEADATRKSPRGVRAAVAAAVGIAAAAGLLWFASAPLDPGDNAVRVTRLTADRGMENEASFSPDGTQFAFTWNGEAQDNFDVYVRTVNEQQPLRLTTDPERDFSPAWSPDGQWIAYCRSLGADRVGIFRRAPLGGREEKLLETSWNLRRPGAGIVWERLLAWSPDSRYLVFPDRAGADDESLYLFSVESGRRLRLTTPEPPFSDSDPAYSPDGRSLAFRRFTNNIYAIYVLPLTGNYERAGEPRKASPDGAFVTPVWDPKQGRLIASGPAPRPGIWLLEHEGPIQTRRLPISGVRPIMPAIRADGAMVVTHISAEMNIWRLDLSLDSAAPEEIIGSTSSDMLPHHSPDGRRIVFLSSRGPSGWIANSNGSDPQTLSDCGITRWSPDGTQLVCDKTASSDDRQGDIWLIRPTGGPGVQLTADPANDRVPSWSRDGNWIYFASDRSGQDQIWRMPAGGAESDAHQLTRGGGFLAAESHDGTSLYYTKSDERGLWTMPSGGGVERKLIDAAISFADFAIGRDEIYYGVSDEMSGNGVIYRYSLADQRSTETLRMGGRLGVGIDLSPDGRYLLYTQFDRIDADLMLVEGLLP